MQNGTEAPVSVWLDNCNGHLRLGDVPPGKTRALVLPERLIPFADQLHFHVFDLDGLTRVGSYAVDLEPRWILSLDVAEDTPELEMVYGDDATPVDRVNGINGFVVYDGDELSYASRWAEDTPAVLTWQCVRGEGKLTLTHQAAKGMTIPVEVVYRGGGGKTAGLWDVYRGSAVVLSPSGDLMEEITEKATTASGLEITVGEGQATIHHSFSLSGFPEARKALGCFLDGQLL